MDVNRPASDMVTVYSNKCRLLIIILYYIIMIDILTNYLIYGHVITIPIGIVYSTTLCMLYNL